MATNDEVCARCSKAIFVVDIKRAIGKSFHSWCFRCVECNATVTLGKEKTRNGDLYCNKCHLSSASGASGFRGAGSAIDAHTRKTDVHAPVATPADSVPLNTRAPATAAAAAAAPAAKLCGAYGATASGRFCGACGEML